MRAIWATTVSTARESMTLGSSLEVSGCLERANRALAPASSMTSMALSGRNRSVR